MNPFTPYCEHGIIWGGNYFSDALPPSQCWLIWDKGQRKFSYRPLTPVAAFCSYLAMRLWGYGRALRPSMRRLGQPEPKLSRHYHLFPPP